MFMKMKLSNCPGGQEEVTIENLRLFMSVLYLETKSRGSGYFPINER